MTRNHRCFAERRAFLQATGAMVSLPFLPSLATQVIASEVSTKVTSSVPRLVCMGVALGLFEGEWTPGARDGEPPSAQAKRPRREGVSGQEFDKRATDRVPKLLRPLDSLQDQFTIISNMDHPNVKGGHKGVPSFLSGVYKPEQVGQSIVIRNEVTVDQYAASRVGYDCRYQSMQLSVAEPGPTDLLSWNAKGVSLPSVHDPLAIYQQLFVDDANPERTASQIKKGRSVLDLVNADAKRLSKKLSKADRHVMDQYLGSVRGVELGIARQLEWLRTPKPGVPPVSSRPTSYHDNFDLMLELTALALQTDSTRVVSVMLPGGGLPIELESAQISNYHGQSHHGKDAKVIKELVAIEKMHTASLAKFLNRLKSIPTDTGTLLDCTQVMFGSGLGNASSHSNKDLPILLAGGGHRHQRHIRCDEGTPLTNLFVTMLRKMNLPIETFADSKGDLDRVLGAG